VNQGNFSRSSRPGDEILFVCCVESGVLEAMCVRLFESLRLFGGRFAASPAMAVTPRFGPPLGRGTLRAFEELDVEYVRVPLESRFSWFHFLNKHAALRHAEDHASTSLIAYLDADTLVLGEPEAFRLDDAVDFAAMTSDVTVGATSGADDPHDAAWRSICEVAGVSIDELPWMTTHLDHERIRLYFQGGVYIYRREIRFGLKMQELLTSVLVQKVRLPGGAWTFLEQALPGPLVVKNHFLWSELPFSHNHTMSSYLPQFYDARAFAHARVVHYHDSMSPDYWPTFLGRLADAHPPVAEWLRTLEPIVDDSPRLWRAVNQLLRIERGLRRRAYHWSLR